MLKYNWKAGASDADGFRNSGTNDIDAVAWHDR
jgi:hypothetical protein